MRRPVEQREDQVAALLLARELSFAVQFGLDAFHGISPTGTGVISSYMPDLTEPGAVKTGEVELVAGAVLKNTLKAGVLRGVAITPKAGA